MSEDLYVLDSNVFIEASRRYYAFDIAPPFWEALKSYARQGKIFSIDRVKDELLKQKDELSEWIEREFDQWFMKTDTSDVLNAYRQIVEWVDSQDQFNDDAKKEFLEADNADAWLLAYALSNGFKIVTHEKYDPYIRREVPIPNVCRAFGIEYIDTFEMLRRLGFKFK